MSINLQKLEQVKTRNTKICFFLNFGLGVVVLPLLFVFSRASFSELILAWLPMVGGYGLLVGYWFEMRSSLKQSYSLWSISLVFNLLLGAYYLLGISVAARVMTGLEFYMIGLLVLCWTGSMIVLSYFQTLFSRQIDSFVAD